MLETGAMAMQADLISQQLGLRNRWMGTMKDSRVLKFCYLDRRSYIMSVGQLFGK